MAFITYKPVRIFYGCVAHPQVDVKGVVLERVNKRSL